MWIEPDWAGKPSPGVRLELKASDGTLQEVISLGEKSSYTFGRNGDQCDIALPHGSASRMHAAIVHHKNGRLYIIDLGATHGTLLNKKKLEKNKPTLLEDKFAIQFGATSQVHIVRNGSSSSDSKKRPHSSSESSSAKRAKEEKVRVRHILVKHRDSRRPSSWKENVITRSREEAAEMVQQFRQKISSSHKDEWESIFRDLASTESHCSSYQGGGDLGFFERGKMQPPFEAASFALKVGGLSDLVYSDSGVHIIFRVA